MKVHSLSTHHFADGGVGEVFDSTKYFRRGKQCFSQSDPFFRCNKTERKGASTLLMRCHPSVRKPIHSYPTRNEVIYTILRCLQTLGWHHTSSIDSCFNFSVVLLHLKKRSQFTSIVLESTAMLLIPETLGVFCGLKHFTHPSIGIVVSG